MNTLKKIGKWALYLFGGIITLILIVLFIIRVNSSGIEEPFLDENGKMLANSIAMHEDIEINGAKQRITIRGKRADSPVLLRVHGGPGSAIPPVITRINGFDLEDLFVVCYWDQRGAGLGYSNDIPDSTITLTQIVEDGLWVANYLREKFGADKIYIEGSSWGTTVSAYMVQKNPALFHAYIGIGQMAIQSLSEQMSYDFAMTEAKIRNDSIAIDRLNQIGRPPYPNKNNIEMAQACTIQRSILNKYVKPKINTDLSLLITFFMDDGLKFGEKFNPKQDYPAFQLLWPTCFNINLMRDIPELGIPVYIIQGDNDHYTETSLAKAYFDSLKAPLKKWFLFENATHAIQYEYPEKYRLVYVNEVLKN